MRVLITGMGGELGTRVANLLEADETVEEILGIDGYPPRRRITRADFHMIDPTDRRRIVNVVRDFDPEVLLHLGVYEPHAHFGGTAARLNTQASAVSTLGAATGCPSLRRIVVRSGIEVYGRRRGAALRPDESCPIDPTDGFGRSMAHVEHLAYETGGIAGVPVVALRYAPIVGPSFPSPLGRYLRLPVVAVSPLAELPFSLLHQEDAALAAVAAAKGTSAGPLNVVGPGAVTASQAVRRGRRVPLPVFGPGWMFAAVASEVLGAPLPPHVRSLLVRGAGADGSTATKLLGVEPRPTSDVVDLLYRWSDVAQVTPRTGAVRR
ncbi:MAG: NAD-dependent epimerase/dehydratase family protein [Acidimicrobiales bacterium]|nr:NAD-dependent epimerase/dehydratase family protein [Acidimicrobiales bacterium]